jgi:hypothetical protein
VAEVVAYGLKTPKKHKENKKKKKQVKWEGEIRKSAPSSSLGDRVFSKVILSSWHKGYVLLLHCKPNMP